MNTCFITLVYLCRLLSTALSISRRLYFQHPSISFHQPFQYPFQDVSTFNICFIFPKRKQKNVARSRIIAHRSVTVEHSFRGLGNERIWRYSKCSSEWNGGCSMARSQKAWIPKCFLNKLFDNSGQETQHDLNATTMAKEGNRSPRKGALRKFNQIECQRSQRSVNVGKHAANLVIICNYM